MANHAEHIDQPEEQPRNEAVEIREIHDTGFMPVLTMQEAQRRFNALKQFVRENMRRDVDYGIIPGTGDKPTLLKPGAEKLCTFFGLRSQFEIVHHTEEWDRGLFYYWYKCRLFRGDRCIAEGEGSANSYERKYRWRAVPEFKATDEEKRRATRVETRQSKAGRAFKMLILENDDPFTLINTLQKMAQKRALIAATLIAVNASEFFTQDIEDMVPYDTETEPAPEPRGAGARARAAEPADEERPEPPEVAAAAQGDVFGTLFDERPDAAAAVTGGEEPQLVVKFKGRPSQETLHELKGAGFRWNSKRMQWEAPASPERRQLIEEVGRTHELTA